MYIIFSDASSAGETYTCKFNDIELAGNGTYTISLENADFAGETAISPLYIATDIPLNDKIKVTDFTVNINGNDIVTFETADLETEEKYLTGGMIILAINHWRDTLVDELSSHGVSEDVANGYTLLTGTGADNITMTFTISGFNYDNPNAVAATDEITTEENTEAQKTSDSGTSSSKKDDSSNSSSPIVIIIVVAVVVVVAGVVVIVLKKKKK